MRKLFLLLLPLAFLVSACAGALPWNEQNFAGINKVVFEWELNDEGVAQPVKVTITDGKESNFIDFKFEITDEGAFLNFNAEDTRAFAGQAIRGEVEKDVSGDVAGVIEKGIDKLGDVVAPIPDISVPAPEPESEPE